MENRTGSVMEVWKKDGIIYVRGVNFEYKFREGSGALCKEDPGTDPETGLIIKRSTSHTVKGMECAPFHILPDVYR